MFLTATAIHFRQVERDIAKLELQCRAQEEEHLEALKAAQFLDVRWSD
jgi:hypothetical protein